MSPTESQREHLGFEILLTPDDVVKILGLSRVGQIYELTREQARSPLPFRRIGKYLRFSPAEVRTWIEQNKNRSAPRARRAEDHRKRHLMEARK